LTEGFTLTNAIINLNRVIKAQKRELNTVAPSLVAIPSRTA